MEIYRALIVDDEKDARDNLDLLLKRFCPEIKVMGAFNTLPKAVSYLKEHEVDVVFLDVEMPEYAGYEIQTFLPNINFEIVFVTAYDQYAIKAFELSALDYLLKPVEIQRLKEAVERLKQKTELTNISQRMDAFQKHFHKGVSVVEKGARSWIAAAQIVALEGQSAYTKLYTAEKVYTLSRNLAQVEKELELPQFFRTHKSWIVNLNKVTEVNYSKNLLLLENQIEAKLSRHRLKEFKAQFSS